MELEIGELRYVISGQYLDFRRTEEGGGGGEVKGVYCLQVARFGVGIEGVWVDGLPSKKCQGCGFAKRVVEAERGISVPWETIVRIDVGRCFGGNGSGVVEVRQRGRVMATSGSDRRSELLVVRPSACIRCRNGEEADLPPENLKAVDQGSCFVEIV